MKARYAIIAGVAVSIAAAVIVFTNPHYWSLLIFAFLFDIAASMYILINWYVHTTAYICPECQSEFQNSALQDLLSPHTMHSKRLTCPECGKKNWCPVV